MGWFSKDIATMDDLFVHTLRDVYYAENQIKKALPDMVEKATNPDLKRGFETHLRETDHAPEAGLPPARGRGEGVTCPAIDGILEEANDIAGEVEDKQVFDAALIAAAQAVEHYEITRYGTLVAWARQLGRNECGSLLKQNLDEEASTHEKLTKLALDDINRKAA
ncbi:ferritin-like domain-containing protein [Bosea sp. F3-2]|uniref:YciE/YciF ferroxidase family protein n=1 Tax=Bosea sp. F3-2 TaxID=2599640 RepID=UPI0011F04275|nr:DUF892 family protein [Bosea sp. F3-2]QEL26007.1 ferritin-like domain-containing protein [Bosea sp. F3-2]